MSKKMYLLIIEFYWWLEHQRPQTIACYGFKKRKQYEHKYVAKFNENIYGVKL